jgi:hypothetical protein
VAQRNKQPTSDPIHGVLEGFFKGLWWLITLPFKGKMADQALLKAKQEFQGHWASIEELNSKNNSREAIMRADILLDKALQLYNVSGRTLGERLKASNGKISRDILDKAWNAHKVRNRLAHELNYQPSPAEADQALNDFKSVLRSLELL